MALAAAGELTVTYETGLVPNREKSVPITMPEVEARAKTASREDSEGLKKKKKKSVDEYLAEIRKKNKRIALAFEKQYMCLVKRFLYIEEDFICFEKRYKKLAARSWGKRFLSKEKDFTSLEKRYKKFARFFKKPKTRNV